MDRSDCYGPYRAASPASTDANCYYNNLTLRLGPLSGTANSVPCTNPTVRSHLSGASTVINTNAISEDINVAANPPAGTEAKITANLLAVSEVGPLSNDGPNCPAKRYNPGRWC